MPVLRHGDELDTVEWAAMSSRAEPTPRDTQHQPDRANHVVHLGVIEVTNQREPGSVRWPQRAPLGLRRFCEQV